MHGNISEFQKRDKYEHNKIRIISFHQISTIFHVIPDCKDKTRYAPYASFKRQISHIATNKG